MLSDFTARFWACTNFGIVLLYIMLKFFPFGLLIEEVNLINLFPLIVLVWHSWEVKKKHSSRYLLVQSQQQKHWNYVKSVQS